MTTEDKKWWDEVMQEAWDTLPKKPGSFPNIFGDRMVVDYDNIEPDKSEMAKNCVQIGPAVRQIIITALNKLRKDLKQP